MTRSRSKRMQARRSLVATCLAWASPRAALRRAPYSVASGQGRAVRGFTTILDRWRPRGRHGHRCMPSALSLTASALVTSASFTAAAQARNIEVGLLLADSAVASALTERFNRLVASGSLERLPGS